MFPRYFGDETPTGTNPEYFIDETLIRIEDALRKQLYEALAFRCARDNEDLKGALLAKRSGRAR